MEEIRASETLPVRAQLLVVQTGLHNLLATFGTLLFEDVAADTIADTPIQDHQSGIDNLGSLLSR